jgi:hypothetical protein
MNKETREIVIPSQLLGDIKTKKQVMVHSLKMERYTPKFSVF